MKKRKTVDRWIANIFPTDQNKRKADLADRKIDQRVGAQIRDAADKTPETDWRRLAAQETTQ